MLNQRKVRNWIFINQHSYLTMIIRESNLKINIYKFKYNIQSNLRGLKYQNRMNSFSIKSQRKANQYQQNNRPVGSTCSSIIFFACTLLLCLVIAINAIYETPLFILGINFIFSYQTAQPYNYLHFLQNLFSLLCNPIGVSIVMVSYYILVNRKLLLIVHLSYFLLSTYIVHLLKQAFQQSRPIWVNDKIQKWEWFCPQDFGNPSGHSFAVVLLYEPIVSDTIGYGKRKIWAFFLLLICVMVPVSRMYLGVHSANQILFGLALGQIFLVLYKYIYQKHLYYLYWGLLMKHHKYKKLIIAIIAHILALIVPIIFYQVNLEQRPIPEKDIENLNKRCQSDLNGRQIQGHMLTSCAILSFFFGIFYGFLLLIDTPGFRKYLLGLWVHENFKKKILKIGIYVLCAVLPAQIFQMISRLTSEPIPKYLFLSLSTMMFGLGLSYLAPLVAEKCKIMKFLPGSASDYEDKLQEIG